MPDLKEGGLYLMDGKLYTYLGKDPHPYGIIAIHRFLGEEARVREIRGNINIHQMINSKRLKELEERNET